jgi:hypothetical protein
MLHDPYYVFFCHFRNPKSHYVKLKSIVRQIISQNDVIKWAWNRWSGISKFEKDAPLIVSVSFKSSFCFSIYVIPFEIHQLNDSRCPCGFKLDKLIHFYCKCCHLIFFLKTSVFILKYYIYACPFTLRSVDIF